MARVRSPNYPALSLPEAIQSVAKVFAKENRHRADKEVIVKAMGYGGLNGASLGSMSALLKYGLLERQGDSYRVTDRALAILHPQTPQEKAEAISQAAGEPTLFAEMLSDFPGSIPSDDNLRSYLVRRGFSPSALSAVIKSFRETIGLVVSEGQRYDSGVPAATGGAGTSHGAGTVTATATAAPAPPPPVGQSAFQISVMADRLILNGTLIYRDTVDDLLKKLEALKVFLADRPLEIVESANVRDTVSAEVVRNGRVVPPSED